MKRIFITLSLGFLSLILNSCVVSKNPSATLIAKETEDHLISKELAVTIQKNFFINQQKVRKGNSEAIANERSDFWFPSEELTNYMLYTQSVAKSNGYEISGYRMYLGAANNENGTIGEYKLFIVPTKLLKTTKKSAMMLKSNAESFTNDNETVTHVDDTNFKPFDFSGSGNPRQEYNPS